MASEWQMALLAFHSASSSKLNLNVVVYSAAISSYDPGLSSGWLFGLYNFWAVFAVLGLNVLLFGKSAQEPRCGI